MPILFVKLDPAFYANPKIADAGRDGREVYLLALCVNAQRGFTGAIPVRELEPKHVARRLLITESEAQAGVDAAIAADLLALDDGEIRIVGWDAEWGRASGKSDAERARAYRDRKRHGLRDGSESPNLPSEASRDDNAVNTAKSNGDSTAPSRSSRARHTSRDQREEKEERETRRDAANSHSIPRDFTPDATAVSLASELGLNLEHEAAQLRDHAVAQAWISTDWQASLRKWLRGSRDRGKHAAKPKRQRTPMRVPSYDVTGRVIELEHEPDGDGE